MLGKPEFGWSNISYHGVKLGNASYLTDVANDCLEACIFYLNSYDNKFEVTFDGEGTTFGLTEICDEIYGFKFDKHMQIVELTNEYVEARQFVKNLAKEVVNDIENNFEDWCIFDAFTEDDYIANKAKLQANLTTLKDLLRLPDKYSELEIGNLLFGNSRGIYKLDRNKWEDKFHEFLDDCKFDAYGHINDESLELKYGTVVDGDTVELVNDETYVEHTHAFKNNTFFLMPYFWGESENICNMPNFIYYPKNIEISWYKYPMRDAWINKQISYEEFCDILNKCKESVEVE